jgi:hypothetical protein
MVSGASQRQVTALLGRYGKAEKEFSGSFAPLSTLTSPSSLKTDKFISFLLLEFYGRITIGVADYASLSDGDLINLFQEVRLYGTHAQFGSQTPIRIRAKTQQDLVGIYGLGYQAKNNYALGGTPTATFTGVTGSWDVQFFCVIPCFPLPMSLQLAPVYSIKGPDWAGNLFLDIDFGDASDLGVPGTGTTVAFSQYGVDTGSPQVLVSEIRPNMTVALMNSLSPGIPFRSYKSVDAVVQGPSFSMGELTTLNIGKVLVSSHVLTGVLLGALSSGTRAYVVGLSNGIVTNLFTSLDSKYLVTGYDAATQQNMDSLLGGQILKTGYNVYNFVRETGNPDSGFPAQTLTSARRFELDANVTGAENQGCEVVQDEILGAPASS